MPADLREHARYPETLFSTQADIYRAYHMRDPEAFFNHAFWASTDYVGDGPFRLVQWDQADEFVRQTIAFAHAGAEAAGSRG